MSLRDEILEQPEVAARFLRRAPDVVGPLAEAMRARGVDHVVIAARGTSDHAAIYAQYVLGVRHNLSVGLGTPSVISLYGARPRLDRSLVVGISQSGASPDVVAVIEEGRRQGAPTLAITNDPASALATAAETTIDLGAGPELAVAATKTYTTELLAIAALSAALSGDPDDTTALAAIPDAMAATLALEPAVESMAAEQAARRPPARPRPRLRVRDRPRVGAQAEGARPGLRRSVLGGRLRARPAGPARARRPGPRNHPARADVRVRWSRWSIACGPTWPPTSRSCPTPTRRSPSRAGRSGCRPGRPSGSGRSCRSSSGSSTRCT